MSGRVSSVAIIGGGIAGVTAAWALQREGAVQFTLFEASSRLGGTVETVHREGYIIECGPDGWVSEKPWARELAEELGLGDELVVSKDADRITYIVDAGKLVAMPDGMRMMIPTDLRTLEGSSLFSKAAQQSYADEITRAEKLRHAAPPQDESVASFVQRHFGEEVLVKVAAPLLSGVFGGDVGRLSVRAVMPAFVQMERDFGSLIAALQARAGRVQQPIFTSLSSGMETLVQRMVAQLPTSSLRLRTPVNGISYADGKWLVAAGNHVSNFDAIMLAVPAHVAAELLAPLSARMAQLVSMEETSAVIAALAFTENIALPKGFGFLVPAGEDNALLACTFVEQKFPDRVPAENHLLRAFFGGGNASSVSSMSDAEIATLAHAELARILGPLPRPSFTVVRRWPRSLPQYAVGHLDRMAELDQLARDHPHLSLLGNAYRGVGLPDLIRDARAAARDLILD